MKSAPDFVVGGAARSGTTALAAMLQEHSGVFMSSPKEPHYLALGESHCAFTGPGDEMNMNQLIVRHEHEYRKLFRKAEDWQLAGEGSVSTLYYAQTAASRLEYLNPIARVVRSCESPLPVPIQATNTSSIEGSSP